MKLPQLKSSPSPSPKEERARGEEVKERPILFSGDMVRALLAGRKKQTRRLVKMDCLSPGQKRIGFEQNVELAKAGDLSWIPHLAGLDNSGLKRDQQLSVPIRHPEDKDMPWEECPRQRIFCPKGHVGDRLWVKETHGFWCHSVESVGVEYAAGGEDRIVAFPNKVGMPSLEVQCRKNIGGGRRKRPSIFMPRWAARINLEIIAIRVERLQDISHADAIAEGVTPVTRVDGAFKGKTVYGGPLWDNHECRVSPIDAYQRICGTISFTNPQSYSLKSRVFKGFDGWKWLLHALNPTWQKSLTHLSDFGFNQFESLFPSGGLCWVV